MSQLKKNDEKILILQDVVLLILFVSITFSKIYSFDFFWHLKTGENFLDQFKFFYFDPYSVNGDKLSWFNFHWGFQAIIAFIYKKNGFLGISIFKSLLLGGILFVSYLKARRSYVFRLVLLTAILSLISRCMVRPELLTYFFIVIVIKLLSGDVQKRHFVIITLIQVCMLNTHSLFLLCPALIFLKILSVIVSNRFRLKNSKETSKYYYLFILSISALFFSPYGINGLLFPFKLISKVMIGGGVFKDVISEFSIFSFSSTINNFNLIYCALTVLFTAYLFKTKKIFEALTVSFFLFLTTNASRNFNLLLFSSLYIFSKSRIIFDVDDKISKNMKIFISLTCIFLSVFYSSLLISNKYYLNNNMLQRSGYKFNQSVFSKGFIDFSKKIKGQPKIFNSMSLGGYLIYYTAFKVFYDGRLDVYGKEYFKNYLKMSSSIEHFLKEAALRKINFALINHSINECPTLLDLSKEEEWEIAYLDSIIIVFVRKGSFYQQNKELFKFDKKSFQQNLVALIDNYPKNEKKLFQDVLNQVLKKVS